MAILGVDDIKAQLIGGGARPNLFQVTMNFPAGITGRASNLTGAGQTKASYMCKMASLPGSTIAPIEVPFRGRKLQIAGDRTFDPWSITVINDTDFGVRNKYEEWMNEINQHKLNTGLTDPSSYMADMVVDQLDKDGTVLKSYDIRGTFPTTLGPIELDYGSENVIEEFEVELQIQYWESNTTS
jgi:hypothetical protein